MLQYFVVHEGKIISLITAESGDEAKFIMAERHPNLNCVLALVVGRQNLRDIGQHIKVAE